jgi:hypothetical protein
MKPGNFAFATALIGLAVFSPTLASADPTLITILALSAASGGDAAAPARSEDMMVVSDSDPLGDTLAGIFGPANEPESASKVSAGVSHHTGRAYHCHRGHHCHTHR